MTIFHLPPTPFLTVLAVCMIVDLLAFPPSNSKPQPLPREEHSAKNIRPCAGPFPSSLTKDASYRIGRLQRCRIREQIDCLRVVQISNRLIGHFFSLNHQMILVRVEHSRRLELHDFGDGVIELCGYITGLIYLLTASVTAWVTLVVSRVIPFDAFVGIRVYL